MLGAFSLRVVVVSVGMEIEEGRESTIAALLLG